MSADDLASLLELCRERAREYQSFELEAQLQGYCTLQMWRAMSQPDGLQRFTDWWAAGGAPLGGRGRGGASARLPRGASPSVAAPAPSASLSSPNLSPRCAIDTPARRRICALVLESSEERRAFSRHRRQQYGGRVTWGRKGGLASLAHKPWRFPPAHATFH